MKDSMKWPNEENRHLESREQGTAVDSTETGHYCVRDCVCVPDANSVCSQIDWLDSSCKRSKYPGFCLRHYEVARVSFSSLR